MLKTAGVIAEKFDIGIGRRVFSRRYSIWVFPKIGVPPNHPF